MRFDDRLRTTLSAETATHFGAAVTWRQLVDLVGRGRADADEQVLRTLRDLRPVVPADVKAASIRALASANPPAVLVALIAGDEPEVFPPAEAAYALPPVAERLRRADGPEAEAITPSPASVAPGGHRNGRSDAAAAEPPSPARDFRFETDAAGVIRWVEGVSRPALVGVSLTYAGGQGLVRIDAAIASAVRRRTRFTASRMEVAGASNASGSWRLTGAPRFDRTTGRFTGFHGVARRPLRHEMAGPVPHTGPAEPLRLLVHELRTPIGAIAGFAELISAELFGPVPDAYRARAADIGKDAGTLLDAIDDLEVAARLESDALDLRSGEVALRPLIERVAADLQPLATIRGAELALQIGPDTVVADERAAERVIGRLFATLIAAAGRGEVVGVASRTENGQAALAFDRPRSLADIAEDDLLTFGEQDEADGERGAPVLGAAFTLRLVRNLAAELGGSLAIGRDRLILRLPAATVRRADLA